jgi:hypothetical protein
LQPGEWRAMYEWGWVKGRFPDLPRSLPPDAACELMRRAEQKRADEECGVNFDKRPLFPSTDTTVASPENVVWTRGTGAWAAVAGCITKANAGAGVLGVPYKIQKNRQVKLAPAVATPRNSNAVIDATLRDYVDAGVLRRWPWEWGWPRVVSNVHAIQQNDQTRVIVDVRYTNAVSTWDPLELPTVEEVAAQARRLALVEEGSDPHIGKTDLKGGYHQIQMDEDDAGLAAVWWRGDVYFFTTMTFGFRNAPAEFQRRMEIAVGDRTHRQVAIYLDDFLSLWPRAAAEEFQNWLAKMCSQGLVFGKKKCVEPCKKAETLGIIMNLQDNIFEVPPRKSAAIKVELERLLRSPNTDTLSLATTLGRLVAVAPAMRNMLLLLRPAFNDLKLALLGEEEGEVPFMRRKNDAVKYAWSVTTCELSQRTLECFSLLLSKWDSLMGVSFAETEPTLIARGDASEDAIGCVLLRRRKDASVEEIAVHTEALSPAEALAGSLTRELLTLLKTLKANPQHITGAAVQYVADNKAITNVFFRGAKQTEPNNVVIDIFMWLEAHKARWQSSVWLPRSEMTREDGLSREKSTGANRAEAEAEWFQEFKKNVFPPPNVDAFAEASNAKLPRFASMEVGSGATFFDGTRSRWQSADVLWAFPPTNRAILVKAVTNWQTSSSVTAYWCVAPPLREVLVRMEPKAFLLGDAKVSLPEHAKQKGWKFEVARTTKKP